MQTFIFQGVIAHYEINNGKVIVHSVDYDGEIYKCEKIFASIGELRRFIEADGWKEEVCNLA